VPHRGDAALLERAQGLAPGAAADVELLGDQLLLGQQGARRIAAVDDAVEQRVEDLAMASGHPMIESSLDRRVNSCPSREEDVSCH
jgi:hypothetical protein